MTFESKSAAIVKVSGSPCNCQKKPSEFSVVSEYFEEGELCLHHYTNFLTINGTL
jgi:hypothetical protein